METQFWNSLIKPEGSPDTTTATKDKADFGAKRIEDVMRDIKDTCNARLKSRLDAREMHLRDELSEVKNQIRLASLCSWAKEVTHDGTNVPGSQVTSLQERIKLIEEKRSDFEIPEEAINRIGENFLQLRQQLASLDMEYISAGDEWARIHPDLLEPNIDVRINAAKTRMAKIIADRKLVQQKLPAMVEDAVEHELQKFEQIIRKAAESKGILVTSDKSTFTKRNLPRSDDDDDVPKRQKIKSVPLAPAQDLSRTYIVYPRRNFSTINRLRHSKTIILNEIQMLGKSGYSILLLLDQQDGNLKALYPYRCNTSQGWMNSNEPQKSPGSRGRTSKSQEDILRRLPFSTQLCMPWTGNPGLTFTRPFKDVKRKDVNIICRTDLYFNNAFTLIQIYPEVHRPGIPPGSLLSCGGLP